MSLITGHERKVGLHTNPQYAEAWQRINDEVVSAFD